MNSITAEIELGHVALAELEASFRGRIVRPADPDYHEHRAVWNGSIDRFPALIARCAGLADVIAAVRFAEETGQELGFTGTSERERRDSNPRPPA